MTCVCIGLFSLEIKKLLWTRNSEWTAWLKDRHMASGDRQGLQADMTGTQKRHSGSRVQTHTPTHTAQELKLLHRGHHNHHASEEAVLGFFNSAFTFTEEHNYLKKEIKRSRPPFRVHLCAHGLWRTQSSWGLEPTAGDSQHSSPQGCILLTHCIHDCTRTHASSMIITVTDNTTVVWLIEMPCRSLVLHGWLL